MDQPIRKTRVAWNSPGHAHFVTYSCFHRLPLLSRDRSCRWVVEALEETRRALAVDLWACVIMPEHVHVLLQPRSERYEMRRILAALKRPVSDAARRFLEQTDNQPWIDHLTIQYPSRKVFRFWQPGGGFDRNIVHERTVAATIEYIHANPIRRGLVKQASDWPWSSARFWDGCTNVPIKMDRLAV